MTTRTGSLQLIVGPNWAFLPDLRLFLGDPTKGAMATVGYLHERIDTWAMFVQDGGEEVGRELFEALINDFQGRRVQRGLPSPTLIELGQQRCVESRPHVGAVNDIETEESGGRSVRDRCAHELSTALHGEYRLTHGDRVAGVEQTITLERRTKVLKPLYRSKMAELGLKYVPGGGIGSRPKKPVGGRRPLRPAHEHTFNAWVNEMKEQFIDERKEELLSDRETRPADFKEVQASLVRSREGEIARKKRDGNGDLKVPYTEFQLLERTATDIARREAAQMMFDFRHEPALVFGGGGRIVIP